jgi:hypothetical protein
MPLVGTCVNVAAAPCDSQELRPGRRARRQRVVLPHQTVPTYQLNPGRAMIFASQKWVNCGGRGSSRACGRLRPLPLRRHSFIHSA